MCAQPPSPRERLWFEQTRPCCGQGAELYEHDDSVDPATSGLAQGCFFDTEHVNLAEHPDKAVVRRELSQALRAGWRGALPK